MVSLQELDFEVFNTAKWTDVLLFVKNLPTSVKLKTINLIDQRSMPRQLKEVLINFINWPRLTGKCDVVTYTCENMFLRGELEALLQSDTRLEDQFEIRRQPKAEINDTKQAQRLDFGMLDRDIHDICDLNLELQLKSTDTALVVRSLHL